MARVREFPNAPVDMSNGEFLHFAFVVISAMAMLAVTYGGDE